MVFMWWRVLVCPSEPTAYGERERFVSYAVSLTTSFMHRSDMYTQSQMRPVNTMNASAMPVAVNK